MPDNTTSFSRRYEEYTAMLLRMAKTPSKLEKYEALNESLAALNTVIRSLSGENSESTLTGERLENLKSAYQNALRATDSYIADAPKEASYVAGEIGKLLNRDAEVINRITPEANLRLKDAFHRARGTYVDIGSESVRTVGGNFSTRMPIEFTDANGVKRQGFFTANRNIGEKAGVLDVYAAKYPKYKEVWDVLRANPELIDYACKHRRGECSYGVFDGDDYSEFASVMDIGTYMKYCRDPSFEIDFAEYLEAEYSFKRVDKAYTSKNLLGADEGSSITDRNCAMTSVAKALGIESVLASSEKMTLMKDGKRLEGCFMETANAYDAHHLDIKDPNNMMWKWLEESQDTVTPRISSEGLKQVADLQLLDYLCGNIDRHIYNMTYKFEYDVNGKVVLSGVVGIDNDNSFGKNTIREPVAHNFGLEGISLIPASTAAKVAALTPEKLEYILADYALSGKELDAAKERLELLQKKILNAEHCRTSEEVPGLRFGKRGETFVIDESLFDELYDSRFVISEPDKHCKLYKNRNLISSVYEVLSDHVYAKYETPSRDYQPNHLTYTAAKLCQPPEISNEYINKKFKDLYTSSNRLYNEAVWNTSEFKGMRDALSNLFNTPADISLEEKMALCNELLAKTQNYIDLKKDAPETHRGKERLSFARRLRDACQDLIDEQREASLNSGELPVAERNIIEDNPIIEEQSPKEKLKGLVDDSLRSLVSALQTSDKALATESLSKFLHYTNVQKEAESRGDDFIKSQIKGESVEKSMSQMKKVSEAVLDSKETPVLIEMLESPNAPDTVWKLAAASLGILQQNQNQNQSSMNLNNTKINQAEVSNDASFIV